MERRKFIQNSIGATVTGSAVINGLYMNQLFGNPLTDLSMIDIPSPNLNRLVPKLSDYRIRFDISFGRLVFS